MHVCWGRRAKPEMRGAASNARNIEKCRSHKVRSIRFEQDPLHAGGRARLGICGRVSETWERGNRERLLISFGFYDDTGLGWDSCQSRVTRRN